MTVLRTRICTHILSVVLLALAYFATPLVAQQTPQDRLVAPLRTDLPGRTVWAFTTTGTGSNITTFAATDKGLFRSSNGGAWSEVAALKNMEVFAVKARQVRSAGILLAATKKGILRSEDGGSTWTSPEATGGGAGAARSTTNSLELKQVFDIEIVNTGNTSTWYAATEKGVYRSVNDGQMWTLLNIDRTVDNNEVRGITVEGNTIIVNLWKEGLWRSTNNGSSWAKLTIGSETALIRAVHAQQGTNATVWLAGSVAGNLWRSVNNGSSWTRVYQIPAASRSNSASRVSETGIDAFAGWERAGTRPNERYIFLFAATPTGIAYSLDEGKNWKLTRTSGNKAIALTAWNNKLLVGIEEQSGGNAQEYKILEDTPTTTANNGTSETTSFTVSSKNAATVQSGSDPIIPPPVISYLTPNKFNTVASPVFPFMYSLSTIAMFGDNFYTLSGFPLDVRITPPEGTTFFPGFNAWGAVSPYAGYQQGNIFITGNAHAFAGQYNVRIQNITGLSNSVPFFVGPSYQDLSFANLEYTPVQAYSETTLLLRGTGIDAATQLLLDGQPVQYIVPPSFTSSLVYNPDGTSVISGLFTVPGPGQHTLSLRRGTTTTPTQTWTVLPATPVLDAIGTVTPGRIMQQTTTVALTGQKFYTAGVTARVYAPNGTVVGSFNPLASPSASQTGFSFMFTPTQAGTYRVEVVNTGSGQTFVSNQQSFSVGYPAPAFTGTGVTPTRVIRGLQATVLVTGTGIIPGVTNFSLLSLTSNAPLTGSQQVSFTPNQTGQFTALLSNDNTGGGGGSVSLPNALTVVDPNPAPASLSLNTSQLLINERTRSITITGTGFLTGSNSPDSARTQVLLDNAPITPVSISATQIVVNVPATTVAQGTHELRLTNPPVFAMANGGGGTAAISYTLVFPAPVAQSLAPATALAGSAERSVILTGTGLTRGTTARFGTTPLTVTYTDTTSITLTLTAEMLAQPQRADIVLTNPPVGGQGGGTSIGLPFTVLNPTPAITSITPTPIIRAAALQANVSITVYATGVVNNSVLVVDGQPLATTVSLGNPTGSLTASIPASLLNATKILSVVVRDTAIGAFIPQTQSVAVMLPVINPKPTITNIGSLPIVIGTLPRTLTLSGTNFIQGATLRVTGPGGTFTLTPSALSATSISFSLTSSEAPRAGAYTVEVQNPTPADGMPAGASGTFSFNVQNPVPTITSVSPSPVTNYETTYTLVITGTGFIADATPAFASTVQFAGRPLTLLPNGITPTEIKAYLPTHLYDAVGNQTLSVITPANGVPGGGGTANYTLKAVYPAPSVSTTSPATLEANQAGTFIINGSNFVVGATTVWLGTRQLTATVGVNEFNTPGSRIMVSLSASDIPLAGSYTLEVRTPKVLDEGGGTVQTTVTVVNPIPTLLSVSPTEFNLNAANRTITLTGSKFVGSAQQSVSEVRVNGFGIPTTYTNAGQLTATLTTQHLATADTLRITVVNPAPYAPSVTGGISETRTVVVFNPQASILTLTPDRATLNGNDLTVTLTGTGFITGADVLVNGTPYPASVTSSSSLSFTMPGAQLQGLAGTRSVVVRNPQPSRGASVAATFTVQNPQPTLSSLSKTVIPAYSETQTLTLSGTDFITGAVATWNKGTPTATALSTSVTATGNNASASITIPASLLLNAGTFTITLDNPAPAVGASNTLTVTVINRVPVLLSVSPNETLVGSPLLPLTLTGDFFAVDAATPANAAQAFWNGLPLLTTNQSRTSVTVSVPASFMTQASVASLTVKNPLYNGQGGGESGVVEFTVKNPLPVLNSITPTFALSGTTETIITLNGTSFQRISHVEVLSTFGTWSSVATTYVSATRLTAIIPGLPNSRLFLSEPAALAVRVVNPTPGGGISAERAFTVRPPDPTLVSLSPSTLTLSTDTSRVDITLLGTGYVTTSTVRVGGVATTTTYVSPTVLRITLSRPAGAYTLSVVNPTIIGLDGVAQGGGTSENRIFTVLNGVPRLTTLLPDTTSASGAPFDLTLTGDNFVSTSRVLYNGVALAAASVVYHSPTELRATFPAAPITFTTHSVRVENPTLTVGGVPQGGGVSDSLRLTVLYPVPRVTSLSPQTTTATLNSATVNDSWTLTVRGTLFADNAVVRWNGLPLSTVVVNNTTLRARVPNTFARDSGRVNVSVVNDAPPVQGISRGGGLSADSLLLSIVYPQPLLNAVLPPTATAATTTRLLLVGTNFAPAPDVQLSGGGLPTPVLLDKHNIVGLHPDSLRITIPGMFLLTRGTYSLRVINPPSVVNGVPTGGGLSVTRTLTVVNPLPALTALLPSSTTASGKPWTLSLVGTKFTATSQVRYNGVLQSLTNTTLVPDTTGTGMGTGTAQDTLRVKLPAVPVNDTTFTVTVYNPPSTVGGLPAGGGESDTLRLAIGLPSPQITTISPATTTSTLGVVERRGVLVVNGAFFDNTAKVFIQGQPVPTEFVATTRLRAYLPDSLLANQARRTVQVRNTPVLVSNLVNFTVQNPTPVLTTLTPNTVTAGRDTVLLLSGDKFAPDASVRLLFGTTATVLPIETRDSVVGIRVRVPAALLAKRGAYYVRVINPSLPLDTTTVGGGSATLPLTVEAATVFSVEYISVDTLLNAGDRLNTFTLRFRDRTGNLVDADPVTLNYASVPDTTLPDSLRPALVVGTIPTLRFSLGTYHSDTLRFPVAAKYRLWTDTTTTGALQVIGKNYFTVLTRSAVAVEIVGLETSVNVGAVQRAQVRYTDIQGNRTDVGIRPILLNANLPGITLRYVVGMTPLSVGVYQLEALRITTSGSYTVNFTGLDTLNITGNRRFTALPTEARSVLFSGVMPLLTAGQAQARFRATFRDSLNNLTDALLPEQLSVRYSNSTAASVTGASTQAAFGTLSMSRTALGAYQADIAEPFPLASVYSLSVAGITVTTGTAHFAVRPAGDARVELTGVRDTLTAGDTLRGVVVKYFDGSGNLTDNGIGDVVFRRLTAPGWVGRLLTTRLSQGVYAVASTQATQSGNYDVVVQGISALNTSGNRLVTVIPAPLATVDFVVTTSAMTRAGARVNVTATYRDRFGNLTDYAGDVQLLNSEFASVLNVAMTRQRLGVYTGSLVLFAPGEYTLSLAGMTANVSIGGTTAFGLEPGPAVSADVQGVVSPLEAGTQQSAYRFLLRDRRGSPTDVWSGKLTFTSPLTTNTFGAHDTIPAAFDQNPASYGVLIPAPTTFPVAGAYTLSLVGGLTGDITRYNTTSSPRTFTVNPLPPRTAFITTTPAVPTVAAGANVSIRVRLLDSLGNRAPLVNGGAVMLMQNGNVLAAQTLTANGARGEYVASFRPQTSGTLSFAFEPTLAVQGTTAVTVLPATDYRVELSPIQDVVVAGNAQTPFTLTYRDRFGNLTDSTVGAVIIRNLANTLRDTLTVERLGTGLYRAETWIGTKADTYLITIQGISAANIVGDSAFTVVPDRASDALFRSVPVAINVGANLPAFTVTYRDRFGNLAEFEGTVRFTNTTSAFVQAGLMPANTVSVPMTRTGIAVSTATVTNVAVAGDYAFEVPGVQNLTGTKTFSVKPMKAVKAEFINVQARVAAGMPMPSFIVLYRDSANNVADYNRNVSFTRTGTPAVKGIIPMQRAALGVSAATASVLATEGTYTLSVQGITIVSGATTVVVVSTQAVSKVDFLGVNPVLTAGETMPAFRAAFQNAAGELVSYTGIGIRYRSADASSSGTLSLRPVETGIYETDSLPFTHAGTYRFTVDDIASTTGTSSFRVNVNLDSSITAHFIGVTTSSIVGNNVVPFEIALKDRFNNILPLTSPVMFVGGNEEVTTTIATQVSPKGTMLVRDLRFPQAGLYTLRVQDIYTYVGNRTIFAEYGKPIIYGITPPIIPLASTTTLQITGANFAPISQAFFRNQPLATRFLSNDSLEVILPEELTYLFEEKDSIYIRNYSVEVNLLSNTVPMKGAAVTNGIDFALIPIDGKQDYRGNVFFAPNFINFEIDSAEAEAFKKTLSIEFDVKNTSCGSLSPFTYKLNNDVTYPTFFTIPASDLQTRIRCLGSGAVWARVSSSNPKFNKYAQRHGFRMVVINPTPKITQYSLDEGRTLEPASGRRPFDITSILASQTSRGYFPIIKLIGEGFIYSEDRTTVEVYSPDISSDSTIMKDINKRLSIPANRRLENINGTELTVGISLVEFSELLRYAQSKGKQSITLRLRVTNYNLSAFDHDNIPTIALSGEIEFDVKSSGPFIYSVRNNLSQEDYQHPNFFVGEPGQQCKIYGINLQNTEVQIGTTVIPNSSISYQSTVTIPGEPIQCEAIAFTLPGALLSSARSIGGRDNFIVRKANNVHERSLNNLYINVEHRKPVVTSWSPNNNLFAYNAIPLLQLQGRNFSVIQPATDIRFNNNIAIPILSSPTPTFNDIYLNILKQYVRAGNNTLRISNPAINANFFSRNLTYNAPYTEFRGGGDTSFTIVTRGITPTNVRIVKPEKVVYFSNQANPYDTTFTFAGANLYFESRVWYKGTPTDTCAHNPATDNRLGPNINTVISPRINIQNSGTDTLQIVNPNGTGGWLYSNPMPFKAYDAALLPRVDSVTPKHRVTYASPKVVLHGVRFNEQTLVRCMFTPCGADPNAIPLPSQPATDTVIIKPDFDEPTWSSERLIVYVPGNFATREGIVSFQALHPDTVGLKDFGKLLISNRLPIVRGVFAQYDRGTVIRPLPIFDFDTTYVTMRPLYSLPTPINYTQESYPSDTLYAGTNGALRPQKYFILRGQNFDASACFALTRTSTPVQVLLDNQAILCEKISDTEIRFGIHHNMTAERFLSFVSGLHSIRVVNADGIMIPDSIPITLHSRTASINAVRRADNRTLLTRDSRLSFRHTDTLRVRIESGGSLYTSPLARNFVQRARVFINGNTLNPKGGLPTTFFETGNDNERYSLEVAIPAFYLNPFGGLNTIQVANPATAPFNGNLSAPYTFGGSFVEYPSPTITEVIPSKIPMGTADTTFIIRGTNFQAQSFVSLHFTRYDTLGIGGQIEQTPDQDYLTTRFIDSTKLEVRLPAKWRSQIGYDSLSLCNPGYSNVCAQFRLRISNPLPVIQVLAPSVVDKFIQGEPSKADTVSVTGQYLAQTTVLWNGTLALPVLSQNATSMQVFIADSLHQATGSVPLHFMNPDTMLTVSSIRVAYPVAEIDTIRPNPIVLPVLPPALAYKEGQSNLAEGNNVSRENLPVYAGLPNTVELFPNAPNPFESQTSIEYALPNDATLSIEVYDQFGRRVADLVPRKFHKAGFYSVVWNAERATSSGIYTAVLQSMDVKGNLSRKTIRMTLIR